MAKICDCKNLYMGYYDIYRVYCNEKMIWPCFKCSDQSDGEYSKAAYRDAVSYVPIQCTTNQGNDPDLDKQQIRDAVSGITLTKGDGFDGVIKWVNGSYSFLPPYTPDKYGLLIVDGDLPNISNIGKQTSSVGFYITLTDDISVLNEGILIKNQNIEAHIKASIWGGTTIQGRVYRPNYSQPISVTANTDLTLNKKTYVLIKYEIDETGYTLSVEYDGELVGDVGYINPPTAQWADNFTLDQPTTLIGRTTQVGTIQYTASGGFSSTKDMVWDAVNLGIKEKTTSDVQPELNLFNPNAFDHPWMEMEHVAFPNGRIYAGFQYHYSYAWYVDWLGSDNGDITIYVFHPTGGVIPFKTASLGVPSTNEFWTLKMAHDAGQIFVSLNGNVIANGPITNYTSDSYVISVFNQSNKSWRPYMRGGGSVYDACVRKWSGGDGGIPLAWV